MFEFEPFQKLPRYKRELVITEKIDGTNACVAIFEANSPEEYRAAMESGYCLASEVGLESGSSPRFMFAGSRKRWIAPNGTIPDPNKPGDYLKGTDNFGFAQWVRDNAEDLFTLGLGRHYGEWYGQGIQRGYGMSEKRFALFNTGRWITDEGFVGPDCCEVVPLLNFSTPEEAMDSLATMGSAVADYDNPEGVVVYHTASRQSYKITFENDEGKWRSTG